MFAVIDLCGRQKVYCLVPFKRLDWVSMLGQVYSYYAYDVEDKGKEPPELESSAEFCVVHVKEYTKCT